MPSNTEIIGELTKMPLVSVVLPTYNGSRYLNESIGSVACQTYQNWELIIVDDASTDATPEIIADWTRRDSRVRCVRNDRNIKLPASLNRGFEIARGDFLTWTSDDNLYRCTALQELLEFLLSHDGIGLVYSDYSEIDAHGEVIEHAYVPEPWALAWENCVRACFMYPAEVRRRIGGYNETMVLVEDWEYWIRIANEFPVECLHRELYLYRRHSNSLTSTRVAEVREAILKLLELNLPQMKWVSRRCLALGYIRLGELAEIAGDWEKATKSFKRALIYAPFWSVSQARGMAIQLIFGRWLRERLHAFKTSVATFGKRPSL